MELFITLTKVMGEPTYGLSCLSSRPGVRGLFSASCIEGSSLDTRWILGACSAALLAYFLCHDITFRKWGFPKSGVPRRLATVQCMGAMLPTIKEGSRCTDED